MTRKSDSVSGPRPVLVHNSGISNSGPVIPCRCYFNKHCNISLLHYKTLLLYTHLALLWSTDKQWLVHVSDLLIVHLSIILYKALLAPIPSLEFAFWVHLPVNVINAIRFVVVSINKHKTFTCGTINKHLLMFKNTLILALWHINCVTMLYTTTDKILQ